MSVVVDNDELDDFDDYLGILVREDANGVNILGPD